MSRAMGLVGRHHRFDHEKAAYMHLVQSADSDAGSIEGSGMSPNSPTPRAKPGTLQRIAIIVVKGLLLLLALWGLTHLGRLAVAAIRGPIESRSCSCGGTTVTEAISRGCIFTPLAIAWLPPHCLDMELANEFDKAGPGPEGSWEYWADPDRKRALNRTEVGLLADYDGVFYTTQDWHITHCTFTWRKHYRQRWTGITIERRSNGLDHIGHCEEIFRLRGGLTDIMTTAGIALDADDPGETM